MEGFEIGEPPEPRGALRSGGDLLPRLMVLMRRHVAFGALLLVLTVTLWSLLRSGEPIGAVTAETTPEQAMAAFLKAQANLEAHPSQIVLFADPRERAWTEALGYVPMFAMAREGGQDEGVEVEDLYYFEARVSSEGMPLTIRRLSNLTSTPYARERLVARSGSKALLAVEVFGQIQSLLLVDFNGDERELPDFEGRADRLRYQITNLQETGRFDGIGLRLYSLDPPAREVTAEITSDGAFDIALKGGPKKGDTTTSRALLHPNLGEIVGVTGGVEKRITYQPRFFAAKGPVPWLVDTVRNHPLVGYRKIALLERYVFYWKDRLRGAAFTAGLLSEEGDLMEELEGSTVAKGPAISVTGSGSKSGEWPPPKVKSAVEDAKPGEGVWKPVEIEWLRKHEGASTPFMKTAVRMDPKRPYDHLVLIAADMRQLNLNMVAGTVSPESSFGTPGKGTIPRREDTIDRLVAAFNGGFKTAHGAFGMQVDDEVILPATPYTATVAVRDDEHVQLGTWNNTMEIPKEFKSLRQNLPPLVAEGKLNPTGKRKWGGTANELDNIHTTRSGLCFRGESTLIYVWGKDTSADSIGAAMLAAGCVYGMHLDMNPTHTGWAYYRASLRDADNKGRISAFKVEKGSSSMAFRVGRYIGRDFKDFFYLTLRETFVDKLPAAPSGFGAWSGAHAPRGTEGFMPLAAVASGDAGTLVAMNLELLRAKLRRGDREPNPTKGLGQKDRDGSLSLEDPVALFDLGLSSLENSTGLIADGRIVAPVPSGLPALVRMKDGRLSLLEPDAVKELKPGSYTDMRGGRALLLKGEKTATRESGERLIQAVGVDGAQRLYYIQMRASESGVAKILSGLGVLTAMELPGSPRDADSRVRFMRLEDGKVREVSLKDGQSGPGAGDRAATTHLYLERVASGSRVSLLKMPDVELSEEESRRQKRLRYLIRAMRQELRQIENNKYKEHVGEE
ncbi:MAG: hypothetical protein CMH57_13660 [Myxococcales bacterium]|nr:hypothetical protein [Myxococcales bacterium]